MKPFLVAFLMLPAIAAAQTTHIVKRGETLATVARQHKYPDVTQNQMILALVRANLPAFRTRSIDRLYVGSRLAVPDRAAVGATDAATADREVGRLVRAEQRYRDAVNAEEAKDHKAAFKAYLDAGEMGHGLAELRLGELYDQGSPAVKRDMQQSARWYQKARDRGAPVRRPETRSVGEQLR
ncbi:MAG TPA: FimV/HubP family polar landmark protein [Burkholderiales bacterium]|nr:FimV/HubP family polar landmark protein [Burkholderiales bacterium]